MNLKSKMILSNKIDQYQEEISRRNYRSFLSLAFGGIIITGSIVAVGICLNNYTEFVFEYSLFFAYMLILYLIANHCRKKKVKYIEAIYYIAITPIMIGGILLGTFLDPKQPAITIIILMCVMMLFIIDKPWKLFLYLAAVAITFIICCYNAKSWQLFMADLVDIIIFFCVSVGVNYYTLKDRVESAENFCMVQYKSEIDALTRLLNRGTGEKKVKWLIDHHTTGAFVMIDIDNFKTVNDTFGHQVGDEVICEVSGILKESFRTQDIVFRLGGDEFAIFIPDIISMDWYENKFCELEESAEYIGTSHPSCKGVKLSIGCTICVTQNVEFESLYYLSDQALYQAKDNGKGTFEIFVYSHHK